MFVRMYVMCGMYVERQIGPVWGLSYWSRLRMIFVLTLATQMCFIWLFCSLVLIVFLDRTLEEEKKVGPNVLVFEFFLL